jgi:hypothetical protein
MQAYRNPITSTQMNKEAGFEITLKDRNRPSACFSSFATVSSPNRYLSAKQNEWRRREDFLTNQNISDI